MTPHPIIIFAIALGLSACEEPGKRPASLSTSANIRFVASYPIKVAEPSGLTLAKDRQSLWTASDDDGSLHQIDFTGRTLHRIPTKHTDVEGIATIDSERLAYIVERARLLVIVDKDGKILRQTGIRIPGTDNKGPEGLSFDEHAGEFHILQERPGTLITLDADLRETARRRLNFARDYSSISFDSTRKHFWILSDRSMSIHVLNQDLHPIKSFSIDVEQMEGLAIDHESRRIYVISDPLAELFVFEFDAF